MIKTCRLSGRQAGHAWRVAGRTVLDDEGVRCGGQPVGRGLGEEGVGGHGQPFGGVPVRHPDGRVLAMPFHDQLVEVVVLGGVKRSEGEVVDDQQLDGVEAPHLGVEGAVQPGGTEPGEQFVGAGVDHGVSAADRDLAERGGQVGLADSDSDGERLQHLRSVLPCELRVTAAAHPLFGRLLPCSGFRRWNGVLLLVVELPDGSPGTVRAEHAQQLYIQHTTCRNSLHLSSLMCL